MSCKKSCKLELAVKRGAYLRKTYTSCRTGKTFSTVQIGSDCYVELNICAVPECSATALFMLMSCDDGYGVLVPDYVADLNEDVLNEMEITPIVTDVAGATEAADEDDVESDDYDDDEAEDEDEDYELELDAAELEDLLLELVRQYKRQDKRDCAGCGEGCGAECKVDDPSAERVEAPAENNVAPESKSGSANGRWSDAEDLALLQMGAAVGCFDISWSDVAAKIGRTADACRRRFNKLKEAAK